jgi:CRISPR-associated endonuclease/helicase Cas3
MSIEIEFQPIGGPVPFRNSHPRGDSPPLTLADLWAKTDRPSGEPALSVLSHGRNVGACLDALVETLPPPLKALVPPGFVTLGAGHDVGKITLGFLQKSRPWCHKHGWNRIDGAEDNHALVSAASLRRERGFGRPGLWTLAHVVRAHHGRYGPSSETLKRELYREWAAALRRQLWDRLVADFGPLPADEKLEESQFYLLTGLLIVADWLGSNEAFFPPGREYALDESRDKAKGALKAIGWPGEALRVEQGTGQPLPFEQLFPPGADGKPLKANALQKLISRAIESPGLHVIEAPMGLGKTEGGLWGAYRLIVGGHHHGAYFGLPTQLTSERIHERVLEHLERALVRDALTNVPLAHANAWLRHPADFLIHPAGGDPQGAGHAQSARFWFNGRRRPLLARYGVGTVDQALMGSIAVRYHAVRLYGLAGKVVILDEVHGYDVYTGTLLRALIRHLLRLHCTVILLSATLTRAQRRAFLEEGARAFTGEQGAKELMFTGEQRAKELMVTSVRADAPHEAHTVADESGRKPLKVRVVHRSGPWRQAVEGALDRACRGDCVLLIRNTVREAQETYRELIALAQGTGVLTGLLHSRFPQAMRERQEGDWMQRLGKDDARRPPGCVLVATQVVEQSVDLDADLLVSELAPTDMLLQRLGRLWRHDARRARRLEAGKTAEFWLWTPELPPEGADADALKRALGRSARVYAPYVLLRSARVWHGRPAVTLPDDIHPLLEETYRDLDPLPPGWRALKDELAAERAELENLALQAATLRGAPALDDQGQSATTRWGAVPSAALALLKAPPQARGAGRWRLEPLEGEPVEVAEGEWDFGAAAALHRSAVRVPWYAVKDALEQAPPWVEDLFPGGAALGVVGEGGEGPIERAGGGPALWFSRALGVEIETQAQEDAGWW